MKLILFDILPGLQAEEIGGIAVAIILVVTLAIVGVIFCVR